MNEIEHQLKLSYQQLYENRKPDEAIWVEVPPAIPFVGDSYGKNNRCKVLVYGSAENLSHLAKVSQELIALETPMDRNRNLFDKWKSESTDKERKSIDNWFPWTHMTPISDGTLLTVARYLMYILGKKDFADEPEAFLQQIAVGNYGKFSQKGDSNEDYAKEPISLKVSDDYVQADLTLLEPDIVVMPRTIHMHGLKPLLHDRSQRPEVWRIHQTNSGVINRTIKKQLPADYERFSKERPEWLKPWLAHIPKAVDMNSYLNWLDWRIETGDGSTTDRWPIVFK